MPLSSAAQHRLAHRALDLLERERLVDHVVHEGVEAVRRSRWSA